MKRAVLIAFAADPYLAMYFKKTYDLYWKDEVDELHIHINGKQKFIIDFIEKLWQKDAKQIVKKYRVYRQGEAFNELYPQINCDILMTMDSDNFIYQKGVINKHAKMVEEGHYDYVGSKKPFMSFWDKKTLDKTEVDFEEHHFKKGDKVDKYKFENDKFMDVMELLNTKFAKVTNKILEIPIDDLPKREHIGRRSFFSYYVANYPEEKSIPERNVLKALGKLNRAAYTYHIFKKTKIDFPYKKYNDYYEKMFYLVIEFLGFDKRNIALSIFNKVKPRLPKELK